MCIFQKGSTNKECNAIFHAAHLSSARTRRRQLMQRLEGNGRDYDVRLFRGDLSTTVLHAHPGEQVQVRATGCVQNAGLGTNRVQVLLALDTKVSAELYDGVPRTKKTFERMVDIRAPEQGGIYMIWKSFWERYFMKQALGDFSWENKQVRPNLVWNDFVAWLVVEIQVEVRDDGGICKQIAASPDISVCQLKHNFSRASGLQHEGKMLIFEKKVLSDTWMLANCGVRDGCKLDLIQISDSWPWALCNDSSWQTFEDMGRTLVFGTNFGAAVQLLCWDL